MPSYVLRERPQPRPQKRTRSQLIYFLCVVLGISLFLFAGIRAAGLSPATITALYSGARSNGVKINESFPRPSGAAVFTDAFVDNSSGWNLQSVPGTYSVAIINGKLTLESDKNKLLWEVLPGERLLGNFEMTVNATLSKGDANNGYGIFIRGGSNASSDLASYYRFELYGDGSYAIFKGDVNQNGATIATRIVDYTLSPAIQKAGKTNHIMIVAQGSYMSLVVNNQLLASFYDTSYTKGSIALFVANLPQSPPVAQAQFSQLTIYPIA